MSTVALPGFSGTGRLRVEAIGSSLKVYVDGVLKINVNDSSLTGAGFVSLRGFKANLDNLDIEAL